MVRDLIELSPQEVTNFLGVSFRKDDQLIIDLIEASKDAAEDCLGDFQDESTSSRINDFESFADTAAMLGSGFSAEGGATISLTTDQSFKGTKSMQIDYVGGSESGFLLSLPATLDMAKVDKVKIWVRGDEDNSDEPIKLEIRNSSSAVVLGNETSPLRSTRFESWKEFNLSVVEFKTIDDIDDISEVRFVVTGQGEAETGTIYVDEIVFTTVIDIPEQVKIGCMRWIANKYENRVSGVSQESEGGISKTFSDSIPEEWRNLRRIPV